MLRILFAALWLACCSQVPAQVHQVAASSFTVLPRLHIRALEVRNDSVVWFAANRGVWGYTRDSGRTWKVDSILADSIYPQFRSLALLNDSTALLLSIASPAHLYKTGNYGKTWKEVYVNTGKEIFFDALAFQGSKRGMALGDPIEGCFQILQTEDGGESWRQKACRGLPPASEGEASFASSNTNIRIIGRKRWFISGGKAARIFRSTNNGKSYKAYSTPLPQGEAMTGIFSFDFFDADKGVIAGGHYTKTDSSVVSLAATSDGGVTWRVIRHARPFFGSCVRFLDQDRVLVTGHDGTFMTGLDSGITAELRSAGNEPLKFFTLRVSPSGRYAWLAGPGGRITRLDLSALPGPSAHQND